PRLPRAAFSLWEVLPAVGVAAVLLLWAVPAVRDASPDDLRVFYEAGVAAWQGHPEHVKDWTGTAFLALLMALVSRASSLRAAAGALNVLIITLVLVSLGVVWSRLRARLPRGVWWATLACAVSFSPLMSTLRWKQLNLIALCLALAGFALIRA